MGASIVDSDSGCQHVLPIMSPADADSDSLTLVEDANAAAGYDKFKWYNVEFHRGGLN